MLPKKQVPKDKRRTQPFFTKYEIARILGQRAQQIAKGAVPLLEGISHYKPQQQATLEFHAGQTPFIIRRYLAMGWYEDWDCNELELLTEVDDPYLIPL